MSVMATYTIIRIYEIPAETQQQATDRMLEALLMHVEKDFHVKDIIRDRPRPNSRVTSRQIDQRSGSASTPASLEATAHDPYVTSGVLWVSVSKVILHHRRMIAAEVQRRVPDSSAS
jgi:hypothetical protein